MLSAPETAVNAGKVMFPVSPLLFAISTAPLVALDKTGKEMLFKFELPVIASPPTVSRFGALMVVN